MIWIIQYGYWAESYNSGDYWTHDLDPEESYFAYYATEAEAQARCDELNAPVRASYEKNIADARAEHEKSVAAYEGALLADEVTRAKNAVLTAAGFDTARIPERHAPKPFVPQTYEAWEARRRPGRYEPLAVKPGPVPVTA